MDRDLFITTLDNPFDPFTQMDRWMEFDAETKGYYTLQKLAFLSGYSHNLSPAENDFMINEAIREMIRYPGFVQGKDGTITWYVPAIKGKTVSWN